MVLNALKIFISERGFVAVVLELSQPNIAHPKRRIQREFHSKQRVRLLAQLF